MNLLSETLRWRVPGGPTQWPGRSSEESRFYWFLGTCCLTGPINWPFFRVTNAELNHGYVLGVLRQSWSDRSRDLENCIVMLISWTGYQWSDRTLSIVLVHRWKCPIRCHQSLIVDHQNYTLTMNWLEELSTFSIGYTSARAFASGLVCHFCFNSATLGSSFRRILSIVFDSHPPLNPRSHGSWIRVRFVPNWGIERRDRSIGTMQML